MKNIYQIRAELKRLIKKKKSKCHTEAEKNNAVNEARMEINKKYGKDWRTEIKSINLKQEEPSVYEEHAFGEHWID